MKTLLALAPLALLGACAAATDHPIVDRGPAAPQGTAVALDQPVEVGRLVATPKAVVEDSRCPINARCVWAGRLIVSTRIDGAGWRETVPLTLGEAYATHGTSIELASGEPGKVAGQETDPAAYRFTYEGGE